MVNTHSESTSPTHTNKNSHTLIDSLRKKKHVLKALKHTNLKFTKTVYREMHNLIYLFLKSTQFMFQICYDSLCYLQLLLYLIIIRL